MLTRPQPGNKAPNALSISFYNPTISSPHPSETPFLHENPQQPLRTHAT